MSFQQSILDETADAPVERSIVEFVTSKSREVAQMVMRDELGVQDLKKHRNVLRGTQCDRSFR
jgi:hypothetical protein